MIGKQMGHRRRSGSNAARTARVGFASRHESFHHAVTGRQRLLKITPSSERQAGLLGGLAYLPALAMLVACTGAFPPPDPPVVPAQAVNSAQVVAPVDHIEILDIESFPPQCEPIVLSGLEDSCVTFGGYRLHRAGDVIRINALNLTRGNQIACLTVHNTVEGQHTAAQHLRAGCRLFRGSEWCH